MLEAIAGHHVLSNMLSSGFDRCFLGFDRFNLGAYTCYVGLGLSSGSKVLYRLNLEGWVWLWPAGVVLLNV